MATIGISEERERIERIAVPIARTEFAPVPAP
jgi:hypothetical protein